MATVNHKVVTLHVDRVSEDPAFVYETALQNALDAAFPPAQGWWIANVEKRDAGGKRDSYIIWAEQEII